MTFKIGDRVRYINNTYTGIASAVGEEGTVVDVDIETELLLVTFDHPCWQFGRSSSGHVRGFWKWTLAEQLTPEEQVIRKCKDLDNRFKNKTLKTRKVATLPFPKEVKYV